GELDPPGGGVDLGVDGHGLPAQGVRRADDPHGDLTAVGDEDSGCAARTHSRTTTSWPTETSAESSTRNSLTVPEALALSSVKFFITSIRPMVCPSVTWSPSLTYSASSGEGRR